MYEHVNLKDEMNVLEDEMASKVWSEAEGDEKNEKILLPCFEGKVPERQGDFCLGEFWQPCGRAFVLRIQGEKQRRLEILHLAEIA